MDKDINLEDVFDKEELDALRAALTHYIDDYRYDHSRENEIDILSDIGNKIWKTLGTLDALEKELPDEPYPDRDYPIPQDFYFAIFAPKNSNPTGQKIVFITTKYHFIKNKRVLMSGGEGCIYDLGKPEGFEYYFLDNCENEDQQFWYSDGDEQEMRENMIDYGFTENKDLLNVLEKEIERMWDRSFVFSREREE